MFLTVKSLHVLLGIELSFEMEIIRADEVTSNADGDQSDRQQAKAKILDLALKELKARDIQTPKSIDDVDAFCSAILKALVVEPEKWASIYSGTKYYNDTLDFIKATVKTEIVKEFSESVFERSLSIAIGASALRVFMSYSSRDSTVAVRLSRTLERRGLHVWLDQKQIRFGDSVNRRISHGIENSDYICILLSPHSVTSNWVQAELRHAIELMNSGKLTIIPILIETCEIPGFLKGIRYADFRAWRNKASFHKMSTLLYEAMKGPANKSL